MACLKQIGVALVCLFAAPMGAFAEAPRTFERIVEHGKDTAIIDQMLAEAELTGIARVAGKVALRGTASGKTVVHDASLYFFTGQKNAAASVAIAEVWAPRNGGRGKIVARAYVTDWSDFQKTGGVCPLMIAWYGAELRQVSGACASLSRAEASLQLEALAQGLVAQQAGAPLQVTSDAMLNKMLQPPGTFTRRANEKKAPAKTQTQDQASRRVDGVIMEQTRCNIVGNCSGVSTDSAGDSTIILDNDW